MDRKTGPMSDAERQAYLRGRDHGYQDGHMAGFRSATEDDPLILWIMGIVAAVLGWFGHALFLHCRALGWL